MIGIVCLVLAAGVVGVSVYALARSRSRAAVASVVFTKPDGTKVTMDITLNVGQSVPASFIEKDTNGAPVAPSVKPTWPDSIPGVLTITPSADGLTATVAAIGLQGGVNPTVISTMVTGDLPAQTVITIKVPKPVPVSAEVDYGTPTP